jgi:mitogen-activated protein kinase organizer 1
MYGDRKMFGERGGKGSTRLGKFGAYKCPHCKDSQIFNTQTAFSEHLNQHIEHVKNGGTWFDLPAESVNLIPARPDQRADKEFAKAMGRNPNLAPIGKKKAREKEIDFANNSLLTPDYLDGLPGQEQGCAPPPAEHPAAKARALAEASTSLPKMKMLQLDCKQGAVRNVRLSVDGQYAMTCGSDKSLKLWNPRKGSQLKVYMGHGFEVLDAQGSCDNSQIVSCGSDKAIVLWDVSSGQWNRKWRGHLSSVTCCRFNEDSSVVITGSVDTTVKVWDCRSRAQEPIQTLEECTDTVTSLDVSNHEILVGSGDGKARLYDLRAGSLLTDTLGGSVSSVRFTRDGQCVLASCVGQSIKLMDKMNGELLSEFTGHLNKEYKLDSCLDHSDQFVMSGSEDASVVIWDLVHGEVVARLEHGEGTGTVHSLAAHPARSMLVTAQRGAVTVWQDKEDEEEEEEVCMSSANSFDMAPHWLDKHPNAVR